MDRGTEFGAIMFLTAPSHRAGLVAHTCARHTRPMTSLVARLRHRIARRSAGLLALLCLLTLGALLAGVPTGTLHAHADGDHGHHHESADPGEGPSTEPGQEGTVALHHHEATCVAKALTGFIALELASPPPLAWHPLPPDASPPPTPRIPPHRPPIA